MVKTGGLKRYWVLRNSRLDSSLRIRYWPSHCMKFGEIKWTDLLKQNQSWLWKAMEKEEFRFNCDIFWVDDHVYVGGVWRSTNYWEILVWMVRYGQVIVQCLGKLIESLTTLTKSITTLKGNGEGGIPVELRHNLNSWARVNWWWFKPEWGSRKYLVFERYYFLHRGVIIVEKNKRDEWFLGEL